eukprot:912694-Rhodomonas_salina.2
MASAFQPKIASPPADMEASSLGGAHDLQPPPSLHARAPLRLRWTLRLQMWRFCVERVLVVSCLPRQHRAGLLCKFQRVSRFAVLVWQNIFDLRCKRVTKRVGADRGVGVLGGERARSARI